MNGYTFEKIRAAMSTEQAIYDAAVTKYRAREISDHAYLDARQRLAEAGLVYDFAHAVVAYGHVHAIKHFGDTVRGFGGIQV